MDKIEMREKARNIVNDLESFIANAQEANKISVDVIKRMAGYSKEDILNALMFIGADRARSELDSSVKSKKRNNVILNNIRAEAALQGIELSESEEMELIGKAYSGKIKSFREGVASVKHKSVNKGQSETEGVEIGD